MGNKVWKTVGIVFIAYVIIWFWPVAFHRPFFDSNNNVYVDVIRPSGSFAVGGPATPPAPDVKFGGDGYEDPVQVAPEPTVPVQQIACTVEAKQCPDGSYVGRQGPKCEFAPCPEINK